MSATSKFTLNRLVRAWHGLAFVFGAATLALPLMVHAESNDFSAALDRAKRATICVLEETQDQRTPDKPGKIAIRGTGFHLRDGYLVTARHAVERNGSMGKIIPPQIRVMTTDLQELPATLVGDNAYVDVVVYRVAEQYRSGGAKVPVLTASDFLVNDDECGVLTLLDSFATTADPLEGKSSNPTKPS